MYLKNKNNEKDDVFNKEISQNLIEIFTILKKNETKTGIYVFNKEEKQWIQALIPDYNFLISKENFSDIMFYEDEKIKVKLKIDLYSQEKEILEFNVKYSDGLINVIYKKTITDGPWCLYVEKIKKQLIHIENIYNKRLSKGNLELAKTVFSDLM